MATTGSHTENPAGSPKLTPLTSSGPGTHKPEEFKNFEATMGKLVQVPKSELDEQRRTT